MGSDYPVGDNLPVEFVRECRKLDEAGKEMVLNRNAERLLQI